MDDTPPKKILMLAPQPFYQDRGTPITTRFVIEALTNDGYKIDLYTFPYGESIDCEGLTIFRTLKIPGVKQIPIGFSLIKIVFDLLLLLKVTPALFKNDHDIIYAIEEASLIGLLMAKFKNIPLIYDMQSRLSEQLYDAKKLFRLKPIFYLIKRIEHLILKHSSLILCSSGLQAKVKKNVPTANVNEWIYPGIDYPVSESALASLRSRYDLVSDSPVILYTGNAEPYQGLDLLFDCIPHVLNDQTNCCFLLVGVEESHVSNLINQTIRQFISQKKIIFVARQKRQQVSYFLELADVAVSPRKDYGNVPLKVFDYMYHGLPMVVTDIATHRHVLDESVAHFVNDNAHSLAKAILQLLADQNEREHMRTASLAYAKNELTFERFQQRLVKALKATI